MEYGLLGYVEDLHPNSILPNFSCPKGIETCRNSRVTVCWGGVLHWFVLLVFIYMLLHV